MKSKIDCLQYLDDIFDIEKECFEKDFWSKESIKLSLLDDKYFYLLAFDDKNIVGYVFFVTSVDEAELVKIAVDKNYRRKCFGITLLKNSFDNLKRKGIKSVFLEVRQSNNQAIGLYKKMGFNEINTRKNFYRFPTEDGIVMKLEI